MIARRARSLGPSATTAVGGDVREREVRPRQVVLAQIGLLDVDRRRRCRRRSARSPRPPGDRSRMPARARSRASRPRSRGRRSRSRRRARSPLLALEQLQAELCRRMAAGTERAARVDHDRERVRVGLLPGRADPERADANRLVELALTVLPVLLDVRRGGAAEGLPDPLLAGRVGVRAASSREPPSPPISSKPSGNSSSVTARASSARASGTVIETRRSSVSGLRF